MKNVIKNILLTLIVVMTTTVTAEDVVLSEMTLEKHAFLPYDPVYFQNRAVDNDADAIALFDEQGKLLSAQTSGTRYIPVSPEIAVIETKDKRYGLINRQGKVLAQPKYNEVVQYTPKLFAFDERDLDLWQLYDRKGQMFAPQCRYIQDAFSGKVAWCITEGSRLIDLNTGEILTQDSFSYDDFNRNGLIVADTFGKAKCRGKTVLNTKGERVIPCKAYSEVRLLENGNIAFQFKYRQPWGVYHEGKEIVKPQYDDIGNQFLSLSAQANEQLTIYEVDGRRGLLDKNGQEITPPKYESIKETANPYVVALTLNGKTDYLDLKTLKLVTAVPPKDGMAQDITTHDDATEQIIQDVDAISAAIDNASSEEIKSYNSAGLELRGFAKIQAIKTYMQQYAQPFEEIKYYPQLNVLTYFRNGNNYGVIGDEGKKLALSPYQNSALLADNVFAVKKKVPRLPSLSHEFKWGAVDINNNTIIPFEYDNLLHLTNECFLAKQDGKWGIINDKNVVLLPPTFSTLDFISDNAMRVINEKGKIGFFNRKTCDSAFDKLQVKFPYAQVLTILDYQNKAYAVVKNDNGVGLFDLITVKEVIPAQYQDIAIKEDRLAIYDGKSWMEWTIDDKP